jgi:hypothetical protein
MPSGKHATGHTRKSGQLRYRTDAGKPQGGSVVIPLGTQGGAWPKTLLLSLKQLPVRRKLRQVTLGSSAMNLWSLSEPAIDISNSEYWSCAREGEAPEKGGAP